MNKYLTCSQISTMLEAIEEYTENGDTTTDYEFGGDTMQMIWDEVKPLLDRSIEAYRNYSKSKNNNTEILIETNKIFS